MAEKSVLASRVKELTVKLNIEKDSLSKLEFKRDNLQSERERAKANLHKSLYNQIDQDRLNKISAIKAEVSNLLGEISNKIDTFLPQETIKDSQTNAKSLSKLKHRLTRLYPSGFMDIYEPVFPTKVDESDIEWALSKTEFVEQRLDLSTITRLLATACNFKASFLLVIVWFALFYIQPVIMTILLLISSGIGISYGLYSYRLLSICFGTVDESDDVCYDIDKFNQDKADLLEQAKDYLNSVADDYIKDIESIKAEVNPNKIQEIDEQYNKLEHDLAVQINDKKSEISSLVKTIQELRGDIESIEEQERKLAEEAPMRYLQGISMCREWLNEIYLGNKNTKIIMQPVHKKNVIYCSDNVDNLVVLSRLFVYQLLSRVHPELLAQYFIDYKYMANTMQPFFNIPKSILQFAIKEEDINDCIDNLCSDIFARSSTILSTCTGVDEFNEIMSTYGVTGESYKIVHLFGASSFNKSYQTLLRNGKLVGIFFYVYLTYDELTELKDTLPYELFDCAYVVDEFCEEKSIKALKSTYVADS